MGIPIWTCSCHDPHTEPYKPSALSVTELRKLLKFPAAHRTNPALQCSLWDICQITATDLLHFTLVFHVQLLSWHLRTTAWNSHSTDASSQMSSLGGRQPYLEMHHFWRLQTSPKKYKGRVSSWKLHSLTKVHFSRQSVVLFPTASPQALLAEFQLLCSHQLRLIA